MTDVGIDALYAAWGDAFKRQDVNAILDLLTPDYELLAMGAAPVKRDDLRPRLAATMAAYEIMPQFEREEQVVVGNLAFDRGWDIQTARPRAGGDAKTQRQRVFLVLRRSDGKWRFARGVVLGQ